MNLPLSTPKRVRPSQIWEGVVESGIRIMGLSALVILALLFLFLLKEGLAFFGHYPLSQFLTGKNWYPVNFPPIFGLLPLLLGSTVVTLGAVAMGIPLGLATAVFLSEVAPTWLREMLKPVIEILGSIPSVVYGFVGLAILAPMIRELFDLPTGMTALTGSVVLAIMILPTIVSVAEDVLGTVPPEYKEASYALGATRWETIRHVTIPAARSGIFAGCMLGLGRAIGETMTVFMVTGNSAVIPSTILRPVRTMTATIAVEMGDTVRYSLHYHALFAIGLVLFLITFIINLLAQSVVQRARKEGR